MIQQITKRLPKSKETGPVRRTSETIPLPFLWQLLLVQNRIQLRDFNFAQRILYHQISLQIEQILHHFEIFINNGHTHLKPLNGYEASPLLPQRGGWIVVHPAFTVGDNPGEGRGSSLF
jgi:hypothetical protein